MLSEWPTEGRGTVFVELVQPREAEVLPMWAPKGWASKASWREHREPPWEHPTGACEGLFRRTNPELSVGPMVLSSFVDPATISMLYAALRIDRGWHRNRPKGDQDACSHYTPGRLKNGLKTKNKFKNNFPVKKKIISIKIPKCKKIFRQIP